MSAGYSGTPLARKLGYRTGSLVHAVGAPMHFRALLAPMPEGVRFAARPSARTDIAHVFTAKRAELARALERFRTALGPHAAVWVSWPKKSSGVATEVTEDTVREVALPLGFVDVKVCAIDDTWSGLKLLVRKSLR